MVKKRQVGLQIRLLGLLALLSGSMVGHGATFMAGSPTAEPGTTVSVPVSVRDFSGILSAQMTIEWDASVLTFNEVTDLNLKDLSSGNFGTGSADEGKVTLSWNVADLEGVNVADDTVISELRFTASDSEGLSTTIDFTSDPVVIEVIDSSFTEIDFTGQPGTVEVGVVATTPEVTWEAPQPIEYGTALGAVQLDATAEVPGKFSYTPAAGEILDAGSHTLSVTFTPDDTQRYTEAIETVTLEVFPATVVVREDELTADGSSTTTVTVSWQDKSGDRVTTAAGKVVSLKTTAGVLSGVTDQGDGSYTAELTSATDLGSAKISAYLGEEGQVEIGTGDVDFVVHPEDVAALRALYEATGGDRWHDNAGWLSRPAITEWYGVEVEAGRVVALKLWSNHLQGRIPAEVGNLQALEELLLFKNRLSGSIPSELGRLGGLTELRLDGNELSGELPPELANLEGLRRLRVDDNPLTGSLPQELTGLDLSLFDFHNTGICLPTDDTIENWLTGIRSLSVNELSCGTDAASVALSGESRPLGIGEARTVTATLLDAGGNVVTTGEDSTLSIELTQISGGGSVEGLRSVFAEGGVAKVTVTGGIQGAVVIGAKTKEPMLSGNRLIFDVVDPDAKAPSVDAPRVAFNRPAASGPKRANLAWVAPDDPDWDGVLIVRSPESFVASPIFGEEYDPGMSIGDGTVVYVGAGDRFAEDRRADAEEYTAFSFDQDGRYSRAIAFAPMVQAARSGELPQSTEAARRLVLVTHGWDSNIDGWVADLTGEIAVNLLDPANDYRQWDVWAYDWRRDAAVPLMSDGDAETRAIVDNAEVHGRALGGALGRDYDYNHVHVIGHGAGAHLIDAAVSELDSVVDGDVTVQATYLDALMADKLKPGERADVAAHYYTRETTVFGSGLKTEGWVTTPSPNARNFALDRIGNVSHSYPYEWYLDSVSELNAGATIDEVNADPDFQGLGFVTSLPAFGSLFDHDDEYNPEGWSHGALAKGEDTALSLVANGSFKNGLDGWQDSGSGTVEVIDDGDDDEGGEAVISHTTANARSRSMRLSVVPSFRLLQQEERPATTLSQSVATPDQPFELSVEYTFYTAPGTLEIAIESAVVATVEAAEASPGTREVVTVDISDSSLLGLKEAILELRLLGSGNPQVGVSDVSLVAKDREPPTAGATVADITEVTNAGQLVTVIYNDNVAIDTSTVIGNDDALQVVEPGGGVYGAEFMAIDDTGDGAPREVTYRIMPPNGRWKPEDRGSYSIRLRKDQIADTSGIAAETATIGAFQVELERATPSISWEDPAPIAVGTPLDERQLNASADVDGTLEYNFERGTLLDVGEYELETFLTPDDLANFATATAEVNLVVEGPERRFEGDVAPRPYGDSDVTVTDWVQVGRFVIGLDQPENVDEVRRIDTAPRAIRGSLALGDGRITVADWLQAGRYAIGLSPVAEIGGPFQSFASSRSSRVGDQARAVGAARRRFALFAEAGVADHLRIHDTQIELGEAKAVTVEIESQGGVGAVSFSLHFDPDLLRFEQARLAKGLPAVTRLIVNGVDEGSGKLGMAVSIPVGTGIPTGAHELVAMTFTAIGRPDGPVTPLALKGSPAPISVADADAIPKEVTSENGFVRVGGSAPRLTGRRMPGGEVELGVQAAPGTAWTLMVSEDLKEWMPLKAGTTPKTGKSTMLVSAAKKERMRFYRLDQR